MWVILAWQRFPSRTWPFKDATCTRQEATCFRRTLIRFSNSFFDIFFSAAIDTPSFFSMFSAPMQATSCFFEPSSLASQTEAFTRVAAAIFSHTIRPLFLFLYLFQVRSSLAYDRLRLRSCVL